LFFLPEVTFVLRDPLFVFPEVIFVLRDGRNDACKHTLFFHFAGLVVLRDALTQSEACRQPLFFVLAEIVVLQSG